MRIDRAFGNPQREHHAAGIGAIARIGAAAMKLRDQPHDEQAQAEMRFRAGVIMTTQRHHRIEQSLGGSVG